jgi:hypothetical protein
MVKIKKNVETIRNQCSSFITPPAHTSDPAVGWLPPLGLVETEQRQRGHAGENFPGLKIGYPLVI